MASSLPSQTTDCPICLGTMDDGDNIYPLLCPEKCGYNFCGKCVEHLVASSESDYEMASDGNKHVKIRLLCPQCRGDLSNTIHDTLLLRKALEASKYAEVVDSELNATELRIKHDFAKQYGDSVSDAEARMRKFHEGTAEPIKMCKSEEKKSAYIDTSLFGGLEYAMTDEEQAYVTALMVAGNADQLAQAAQILHGIAQISLQGITPSMRGAKSTSLVEPTSTRSRRMDYTSSRAGGRGNQYTEERKNIEALETQKKLHPLPARMPRYALLTAFDTLARRKTIKFENDEWDGSLADAFVRMQTKAHKNSPGVDRILSMADDPQLAPPMERVKVTVVRGEAGRLGLQIGDVVTHVNGEKFVGDAEHLNDMILRMYNEDINDPITFSIVVNAEASTAEVLKLRAKALTLAAEEDDSL